MKYALVGLGALLLAGCSGFNLPVIPTAPTVGEVNEAQAGANKEIQRVCESLDQNEKNLAGWLDFAAMLGGAFDIEIGKYVEIPADLVETKDKVCE